MLLKSIATTVIFLTAGVGSVMGILSAAMASFAMRELRDIPADETRWLNLRSFF